MRVAAIDIGTVSTRLLIADVVKGELTEVVRKTLITHLGEDLTQTGLLSEEGMSRVCNVVQGFMRDCAEAGCERMMAVATSASRDAENGEEFMRRLSSLGVEPEIISGGREASLSFLGATYLMDDEDILVADIGGGSTELILGSVGLEEGKRVIDIDSARSIDVGSRRGTEIHLRSDPPTCDERDAAMAWMVEEMRPFFDGLRRRPRMLIALAGTATSIAAIHLGLPAYDAEAVHGARLSGGDLVTVKDELASLTVEQRKGIPSLDPGRAGVIVAGAMILEAVLALAGLDSVTVSEHDILYGIALTVAE